ncbi:unnamed protein product [Protopolystoma xenopodis]|uniref:Uncharacterized protein n=1 Tax=Protopolystoma xenopodis TaxID=117903 RepID=A0A3S5CM00_9PLAT|nr:unnamed protein product [Protopolystoma xenopodis]
MTAPYHQLSRVFFPLFFYPHSPSLSFTRKRLQQLSSGVQFPRTVLALQKQSDSALKYMPKQLGTYELCLFLNLTFALLRTLAFPSFSGQVSCHYSHQSILISTGMKICCIFPCGSLNFHLTLGWLMLRATSLLKYSWSFRSLGSQSINLWVQIMNNVSLYNRSLSPQLARSSLVEKALFGRKAPTSLELIPTVG